MRHSLREVQQKKLKNKTLGMQNFKQFILDNTTSSQEFAERELDKCILCHMCLLMNNDVKLMLVYSTYACDSSTTQNQK